MLGKRGSSLHAFRLELIWTPGISSFVYPLPMGQEDQQAQPLIDFILQPCQTKLKYITDQHYLLIDV